MSERVYINYKGRELEVKEPTVDVWKKVYATKDVLDVKTLSLNLVSASTGLTKQELEEADWYEVIEVANFLLEYYDNINTEFIEEFTFEGKEYRFINLDKISFGLFIDIDTFLKKPEVEKIERLHYYLALLYCGVDENPLDIEQRYKRAEVFRDLPIKYYLGANTFFLRLEKILQRGIVGYLTRVRLRVRSWILRVILRADRVLITFGVGTQRLVSWLKTILQRLRR